MINVVSKSNWQYQQQRQAQRVPHYGLRKLSVGVASVLLSTTLYMGVSAHADTVVTPSETSTPSTTVTTPNLGATETTSKVASLSANDVNGANVTSTNSTSEVPTSQVAPVNTSVTPEKPVNSTADAKTGNETAAPNMAPKPVVRAAVKPVVNAEATETTSGSFFSTTGSGSSNSKSEVTNITSTSVESDRSDVQLTNTSVALLEMVKPATAWQPEPTTNYSADHTAKIDMTNQPTTVQGDNWQMSLDKNYIKAGQAATLTVNYEAQAGDTFVLDIGYPAGVNAQPLSSQIGTTSTKDNGLRTQVINVFKQAGTYTQAIKLNGWKNSAEGLNLLRHVFGDQTFDLTLKRGTSVENAQDVGRLYLTSSFTPTMSSTGSVGVDRIDAKYVPVLSTNNNYIFTVRTNWSDFGTALEPSYNGDFVYSISVPKTFELDQAATEAFYQQIHNNELFGNWGNRGSNVTVSQAGVGAPVIIKANALDRVAWHYVGNEGVSFLGHFIDAPSVATMVTAEGQTTVSDTIGDHTQTVILPGLAAKVINAADYNYDDSGDTVLSVSDYGDDNQLYQSHEVPMTGNGNSVRLIHDLSILNNSPFDVKNATVTLTFGDGLHVDVDSVRNNSYISNLLADNYIHPNREKSLLVTYQDGTSEMVPFNSKGDPTKNIKSITLTRDWNAGQMAGMHGDGIRGFVASTYQDGSPVKIGDTIKVSLTVAGVNTAGHNVSKTVFDTLKVVDQRFAPLTTRSFYGGIDKTGLGDNPSGTINIHWDRTSGERSKIQLENPTIYFVMPNTVAQIQNPRWGFQKDLPGNVAPTLTSITYEKSKDGKNTVAIMHFSGTLIDQAPNNYVPLFFDGVNKDNVVNQTSEGFLYWTADNVNADGLTKIDPTRADSQNKVAHLPADLSQEQLNKIYLHSPCWGSINMATGIYSTSATKTASTPWRTQTIMDYHGDGQADLGVNLVNDTSNALHNVVAIINLPKATSNSSLTANLTGNTVELIDPNADRKLTDGGTVLYSTKSADLSSNDLSSFVTADQIKDWSKVQAVAVILQNLGGMTSRQVQIPVVVNDLVANAGKTGTVGTRISADELKPIIVSADAENAAKLVVGGQATIHVQMHYQDAQGKDHYVPLTNPTHAYDILQYHVLNSSDFTPSTTDLAQIPGYELSKTSPTIISGKAVIGQPVSAQDDDSVLQFELVPSAQKVLINYVDDDDNQKVIKTDTLTGKTGETQQINVVTPDNYVLVNPATNPSEYTFLASDNKPITIHLKHQRNTTQEEKTVTRKVTITTPDNKSTVTNQTVTFTRNATVDEVTGNVTYGPWSENGKHEFATVDVPTVPGYTANSNVPSLTVTPDSKDTTVTISYTANKQQININYVDVNDGNKVVHTTIVNGVTDGDSVVPNELPAGYKLVDSQSIPKAIHFNADNNDDINIKVQHATVTVTPDSPKTSSDKLPDNPNKTYPSGVSENDLNKTVTRTIKVTQPNGTTTKQVQTVKLTRTATVDEVTGEVTYGKWSTGQWGAYDVPTLPGYTATQTEVVATSVDEHTTDQTVDISYTPNKQTTTIKYVDNKGEVVHTTTVDGVTNQTVKVSSEVPDGWTITKGQVPSEITFGPDGHDNVTVTVEHQHVTVTPDNPQTNGTKLPDNPTKTFNGVAANDLNKTITRTIKVTTPDGKVATVKQEAKLTRTADVDEVTGEVTYGKWTTGEWPNYDVPTVPGYTASQTSVAATPVDENTKDQTVDINYTANPQTTHVDYVDTQGNLIHVTTVNGQTNQTVKVSSEIPDGWKLVDGQTVPNMITFGPDGHADMSVKIEHQHVTVTPDKPQANGTKLPDNPSKTFEGVEANDLNKTITRTIKVTTPNGKTTTTKQTAKLTRTADVDEVTGEVTYGNWTTGEWAAYDVPSVVGYTPSQTAVAKESVTATSKDTTVEITYLPMQHQISVEYVDDDDHGKIVKTDQMPGKTDQTITVTPSAPSNYDLVDNGNRTYTVTSNDAQVVQIHVKHHQVTTSESKTVTRTINVHTPHDGTKVVKQNAELTRKVTTDQVTGEKTYGDWTTGQWESYTPEAIPGYTPSTNEVPNTNVNGNSKNQMIDVTYTADAQKVEIVYVDDTKGDAVVKTDQIAGKTDETVKVTPDVPAGYELVGKVPGDYTMTAGGHQTITVHLVHQMKTVSESKTVTRTINVHTPHDGAKTIKQTAELTRDVTTDQVTGEKTYGDWSTAEWDRYAVPAIAGYVPSVEQVAQQVVNGITTDQIIDVTYSSGEHTTHINYVDSDGNIVHTTTIKGQTDGTAQVPNETPAGWTVVGEPVPTELAFGPDGHSDVTVTVDHQHVTVTPDQPKIPTDKLPDNPAKMYPNGVGNDNLNKTITRTIKIVMPDGQTKTVAQTAHLTRTADVDEVTGEVTYGKWTTGEWSNYDVPTVPGYTPSQSEVPAQTVSFGDNDVVKTVTYKANTQKLKVVFIDDTTGKTLNTIEKAGLSDTDSGYNTKADISDYAAKHYDLVSDGTNGQNLVFDHDDGKDQHYEVHLVHATHPIDEQVSTKQTIHYQLVDGTKVFDDHTAQVDFSRDGYNDEVTNENHWNKWTPSDIQTFSKVVSPVKSGYTPDKASVAAVDVHPSDKNVEETVIYSPDKQVMTINYIDDVTGKTLSTKQITGFSDASANYNTKSSINSYVAGHYKLVSDDTNSDNLVFDHADSIDQVYNVHLTHSYQKVDDHKSVNETVHYIYDDGQTARPDYKAPAINFSRTGTKDLVTSNIVWNTWTPAEQNFDQVTTPAISGYTPDVEVVPSVNVSHGSDDLERTVIYHADDQTILVNYIDDDTHSTLKTDTVIGKTAQKSNYTTKKSIDGYIADHYKLVSDDTNDNELVFDSDSTKAQVYNVHLKHVHQNVSDSALVNETIHYVYADGSKARNDYHAPVISFKRTGDKDLVTNVIVWNDWIPASQDFKAVDSPVIDGYTPSQKTISNITVKPGDKDIDQTVVYAPDTQSIFVNYIDDVTGKTLKTDTLTGKSDRASDYTTKNNINSYENQHYVLVSDDTQGKTLTFDHDDKATQVYNVHLSHQTELASQSRTVHETINYVYADGSKASDTVTANPLTFTQTGVKDLVTNAIAWNDDWTSKQTFAEVKSPEITGYTASRTSVDPITVDHNSSDIHQTVIYTANDQTARINYIDDVTGKTLETDSANGKFGDQINFGHDVDTQIKVFEGQGYKFKSNSFNGQKYQADNSQNEFEIHFTHGTQNVSRTNKVTETVKYQFADGRQAQKDHAQTVEFTQHGVQDLVTKTTVWTPSDPQTFASVDTPHITGYTSDIQNVPAATVNFGDEDIVKTVTYKANQQKLDVVFIDDVTGQVLKTANKIGLSDTDSGYNTKADISDYAAKHYDLVSDGTNGQNLVFDHDDSKDQHYEVHLTHHKSDTSRQSTVNETIHYVYENSKQAADDYVAKPIAFTQTGVKDLVTGDTDWNGRWTSDQEFKAGDSPEITGYTPSRKTVDAIKVSHDTSDIKRVVTYVANNQVAKITYIDDVTGKVLATDEVSGKFGSGVDYNALARINSFEKQGYQLKTNGFDQSSYQADDTKNQFEIRLIHQLNKTSRESTVTRTISYVDSITGLTLHQPIIQTLKFIEGGVTDLVTNETTWQTASRQQFVSVKVPEIKGYASELSVVEPAEVGFGDANIETTVKYKKLDVANTISYVDSQGKVIKTDTVSGQSGTEIKLDVPSGYHLVDNQTKETISENNSTQTVKITKDNSANKIARHLPQTGNQRETGLVALGFAASLLGLVVLRKKRN